GVNIAARLEGQAPSGGILASDVVHAQITRKLCTTFIDMGEIKLKNIDRPVRAWRWTLMERTLHRAPFGISSPRYPSTSRQLQFYHLLYRAMTPRRSSLRMALSTTF